MRYHLKERFLTLKDDFTIKNDRGDVVFDVRGSLLHIGDHIHIYDRQSGEEVFSIKCSKAICNITPHFRG